MKRVNERKESFIYNCYFEDIRFLGASVMVKTWRGFPIFKDFSRSITAIKLQTKPITTKLASGLMH